MMPPPPPPPPPIPNMPAPAIPQAPTGRQQPGGLIQQPALPQPVLNPGFQNPSLTFNQNAPQSVLLRLKFTQGDVIRYHLAMDINGNVQVGDNGTKQPLKEHVDMTLTQTVKNVTGDQATISEQMGNMAISLNGKDVPLPPQTQQQTEQPFTLVETTRGKVISITAPTGGGPIGMPGMNPTQMENMETVLPEGTVTPGTSTWRSDVTLPTSGIESHSKFSIDSLSADGNLATIGQKLWIQFKPATGPGAPPMKLNGLMTGTGTQTFDVAAGQIASQTNDMHLTMSTAAPGSNMTIKTDFQINVHMDRVSNPAGTNPTPATPPAPAAPAPGDEPPTNQLQ